MVLYSVTKIPLIEVIFMFLIYVVAHIMIGFIANNKKKEFEANKENKELEKEVNRWSLVFKWFPAAYVVLVLAIWLI